MDLPSTILGILSWKPLSGYDLKRIISDSDIFYWSGNNNQIYKSLIELQQAGKVSFRVELQDSLPAKKIYSITPAGQEHLRKSLLADPQRPELRKGFLIQLAWSQILSDAEIEAMLQKYEEEIDNQLRMHLEKTSRAVHAPARSERERYLWERVSANLTFMYQAELAWVKQTRQGLQDKKYLENKS